MADAKHTPGFGPVTLTKDQRRLCAFGGYDQADLRMARLIAAEVCERYSYDTADELERIRKGEIWNDHPSVQAALAAIRVTKDTRVDAASPDLLAAAVRAKDLLKPEVTKEPARTIFWELVAAIAKATGAQ